MKEDHYLVSVTIKKAEYKSFGNIKNFRPFCILDVMGKKKCTTFCSKTTNPVWNQRLDIVLDSRPSNAAILCKNYLGEKDHAYICSCVLDLNEVANEITKTLSTPIYKTDVTGDVEKFGDLYLEYNFQRIPSNRHHHYSWTHILHLDIIKVDDLPLYAQVLDKSSNLVLLSKLGVQQFNAIVTDIEKRTTNAPSGFIFIDKFSMKESEIELTLQLVKDGVNHIIGFGKIPVASVLNENASSPFFKTVLFEKSSVTGTNLPDREIGKVISRGKLLSRDEVESNLYDAMFEESDYDFDGRLDRQEVFAMMNTIHPHAELGKIRHLMESAEFKGDFLYKDDFRRLLTSSKMHKSPYINLIIISSLKGRCFPVSAHLLRGFSYVASPGAPFVKIHSRDSGEDFEEIVPTYIQLAIKAIENSSDKEFGNLNTGLMPRLTHQQGYHFDSKNSRSEIVPFISLHNIDTLSFKRPLSSFANFNDFFSRELSLEERPVQSPENMNICVSPCDCRMVAYDSIDQASKIWVKGSGVNIRSIICNDHLASLYTGGSVVICRLAPQDAHSWGSPVDGVFRESYEVKSEEQFPLHPFSNTTHLMHRNHRVISEIDSEAFGKILCISIGGPMVNSISLEIKPMQRLLKGNIAGRFRFGGSTILLFFRKHRISFDEDLVKNSCKPIETFVKANQSIGVAVQNGMQLIGA